MNNLFKRWTHTSGTSVFIQWFFPPILNGIYLSHVTTAHSGFFEFCFFPTSVPSHFVPLSLSLSFSFCICHFSRLWLLWFVFGALSIQLWMECFTGVPHLFIIINTQNHPNHPWLVLQIDGKIFRVLHSSFLLPVSSLGKCCHSKGMLCNVIV